MLATLAIAGRLRSIITFMAVLWTGCAQGAALNSFSGGGASAVGPSAVGGHAGAEAGGSDADVDGSVPADVKSSESGGSGINDARLGSVDGPDRTGGGGTDGPSGALDANPERIDGQSSPMAPDAASDGRNGMSASDVGDGFEQSDTADEVRQTADSGPDLEAGQLGPCTGLCGNPIIFNPTNFNSGALGTMATCHETILPFHEVLCGNFVPSRTFAVNGNPFPCDGTGRPPGTTRNGGYCFQASAAANEIAAYFATF